MQTFSYHRGLSLGKCSLKSADKFLRYLVIEEKPSRGVQRSKL